ncbi:MAG: hypothetical protein AUJ97_07095, partial [Bacteroidetes bacterium CG2_30_32_10]
FIFQSINNLQAQSTSLIIGNQNPFKVKWNTIETPQFTIIFPKEIEKDAQKVANTLNYVYPYVAKTSAKIKPLNVVLQTNLAESNGFATITPRRMEFYNTPPQTPFAGTLDWYSLLSIHELRHITQFSRCDRGFTKIAHILFGNSMQNVMMMTAMPNWFFEGDAVATETALTNSGRGRLPQFNVEMRSLLFAGKRYDYEKVFFGSYKNWYPLDASYSFGYQFVTFIRNTYGLGAMNKLVKKGAGMSINPYLFSWAMRRATGHTPSTNYQLMLNKLDSTWNAQLEGIKFTEATPITKPEKNNWTYNNFAKYTNDGNIIVSRYGQEDIYQLVLINPKTNQEKKLYSSYLMSNDVPFSVSQYQLVWAETKNDIRWGNRSYSNIKTLDINTGKLNTITKKAKYYAPAIDPSGKQIVCVEYNNKNICSLLILDAITGQISKRIPNPENELFQTPTWSNDGKNIVFIKLHPTKGKALCLLNIETGITENLIDYSNENIAYPVCDGNYIYYDSPISGIDNIYAISINTKEIFQVTSRKLGSYYPAISNDGSKLLFSEATDQGYMLMEMPLDSLKWLPLNKVEKRLDNSFNILVEQEQKKSILDSVPTNNYQVSKYALTPFKRNAYSWYVLSLPTAINLSLKSQNPLSSFATEGAYNYNYNENANSFQLNTSYAGLYPIINMGGIVGRRVSTYDSITNVPNILGDSTKAYTYSWNEKSAYFGLELPLNLSSGSYVSNLTLAVNAAYTNISDLHRFELFKNSNGTFFPITYSLDYSRRTSWLRDMLPTWGQTIHLSYAHTPFNGDFNGDLLSAQGVFYFPGIIKHHSLFFEAAYEKQNPVNYRFESKILFPRAYKYVFEKEILKGSVNYTFPIAYPDFSLIHSLYFKRLAANLFYDYGIAKSTQTNYYRSTGIELKSETFVFHIPIPFIVGLRGSYLFDNIDNEYNIEGIFALSF